MKSTANVLEIIGVLTVAIVPVLYFGGCEEPPEAVAPGALPVKISLESAIHCFDPELDASSPGANPANDALFQSHCDSLKNNVFFVVEDVSSGAQSMIAAEDVKVDDFQGGDKVRCRFTADVTRFPGSYKFFANISSWPLQSQVHSPPCQELPPSGGTPWQASCTFEVQHPDLQNAPGSPLFGFQHWVHFRQDPFAPTTGDESPVPHPQCCSAQQHHDNQPDPPGFPPDC